jgi:hypothetical protein
MSHVESDIHDRVEKVLDHCKEMIKYYETGRTRERRLYRLFQTLIIILSALTPILILWTEIPKPLQALPAALASIAAGVIGIYHFHENWISSKNTAEALKNELLAYETRTTELYRTNLSDFKALDNFVIRIRDIQKDQITEWSTFETKVEPEIGGLR